MRYFLFAVMVCACSAQVPDTTDAIHIRFEPQTLYLSEGDTLVFKGEVHKPDTTQVPPASGALLDSTSFDYLGAFRVPSGADLEYGGTAIAVTDTSIFLIGHDWRQMVTEITLESPVISGNLADLNIASVLQDTAEILNRLPKNTLESTVKIGGLLVIDGKLHGTAYEYYDADTDAEHSHFFFDGLNLDGNIYGLCRVGEINPGYVAGYMTEHEGEFYTGQSGIAIVSRTSVGPSIFGFNPSELDTASTVSIDSMLFYTLSNPITDNFNNIGVANDTFNLATKIEGVIWPDSTDSIIFLGSHGTGEYCYGTSEECDDPCVGGKGNHSYPYTSQAWFYDIEEIEQAVEPWDVQPYQIWQFTLPFAQCHGRIIGAAYNDGKLYLSQYRADGDRPLIHVFEVN